MILALSSKKTPPGGVPRGRAGRWALTLDNTLAPAARKGNDHRGEPGRNFACSVTYPLVMIGAAGGGGALPFPTAQAPTLISASAVSTKAIFFISRPSGC